MPGRLCLVPRHSAATNRVQGVKIACRVWGLELKILPFQNEHGGSIVLRVFGGCIEGVLLMFVYVHIGCSNGRP